MGFRFFLLNSFFILLYALLGFNLYNLQIEKGDYYFNKAQARADYQEELELRRGGIFFTDKNGNLTPIALNKNYPVVYAVPKEIDNPNLSAVALAPVLNWEEKKLLKVLSNSESLFRLLADKAEKDLIDKVIDLDLKGIYVSEKQHRFYPYEKLAASLLGFVGINEEHNEPTGLYGEELFYNNKLKSGDNVYLTIDRNLQTEAEETLKGLVSEFGAEGGSILIQDPFTGSVLALANNPGFNPNDYGSYPIGTFLSPAVQYVYEAGSVFKPITMATGIDLGILTPDTTYIDYGSVTLNGKTITNWDKKVHGKTTMTEVIEGSINTGAVFAVSQIGRDNFITYLKKFGFGRKTGIDSPNEVNGNLRNLENKHAREIDFATASFGQGTAVTPIQLITAYSAIANGGLLLRPYLNRDLGLYVVNRVISKDTAEKVTKMMVGAVEKARVAAIPGYKIAGKTGTAQIPDFENGGYSEEYIHSFVGFAPASDPKFVILIKLNKPDTVLAGQTVVPAFRELAQYVLNYYNIPPDNLKKNTD